MVEMKREFQEQVRLFESERVAQTENLEALRSQTSQLRHEYQEVAKAIQNEASKIQSQVTQEVVSRLTPVLTHDIPMTEDTGSKCPRSLPEETPSVSDPSSSWPTFSMESIQTIQPNATPLSFLTTRDEAVISAASRFHGKRLRPGSTREDDE